jgi:hypothetical protein
MGLVSCHLASQPDPPSCARGSHPENNHCVADPIEGPVITIAVVTGAPCTVSPESITVLQAGEFSFKNEDSVDHVVTGADGKEWVKAPARQPSPFVAITKAGSWAYTVSGCAKGGTVVVQ